MCSLHTLCDLHTDSYRLLDIETTFLFNKALERNTLHKLHNDVIQIIIFTNIIHIYNIRM